MVFDKEFIWRKDHFAYHITKKENMESIIEKGLIPQIGDRSKSVGDDIKAVYFIDDLSRLDEWIEALYKDEELKDLEILKFNLKNRKWYIKFLDDGEFYTPNIILPNKIEFLRLYDEINECYMPLSFNIEMYVQEWEPIYKYKESK